ncbi:hypothetical protein J5N97_027443 [Dioscorea zingiberensis]|uniref:Uncharacterized protein n=1 Tax=Dioscorea zingiberensis TaxID=325984 RepID=A0A9D5C460_9LILI|nr:hypothetical protein J5N97_027443 [Dioscorea zingiberensis]
MEEESRAWLSSSANWIVSDGSIDGSISFDTSRTPAADDGPEAMPTGVLLLRPPLMDSLPCEITIHFRSRYEIHRVYVRSTARVFEIYYTSDKKDKSSEYLCTVRCGEVTSQGDDQGYITECQKESKETAASPVNLSQNDDGVGEEDGWVEVKVPCSPNETNPLTKIADKNTSKIKEVLYEATAEIADASPCVTLTLRLLSLKNKACVHVEEIYIYADPVELTDPDNSGSTTGSIERSSLFAMLAPNLLQLSKSGNGRTQDRYSSDDLMVQKPQNTAEKAAESSMVAERKVPQEINQNITNQRLGMDETGKDRAESTMNISSEKDSPVLEQNNLVNNRVEKVLDELVSRVGNIEAFCSRFEENMMKPLSSIEMRLQRLEHQLEAFAVRMPSSEPLVCSKISAPEFSFDESDSEHNNSNTSQTVRKDNSALSETSIVDDLAESLPDSQMSPCLVVKAPEFSMEDDEFVVKAPEFSMEDDEFVVKAPEFSTEYDERIYSNETGDTLNSVEKDPCLVNKSLSIEDALASALEAFLSSTAGKFPRPSSTMTGKLESSDGENNAVSPTTLEGPPEGSSCPSVDINLGEKHCSLSDTVSGKSTFDVMLPLAEPANMTTPVFDSQKCAAPESEFPTKEDDSINQDNNSDSGAREFPFPSVFASFLSPMKEASEVSYCEKNELAASSVEEPCGGDEPSGVENCSKDKTVDADLSLAATFLPLGLVDRQNEHETGEKHSSMGVPAGGSNPNGAHPEVSLEQKEHILKWQEYSSASEFGEVFAHLRTFVGESNSSHSNWHDGQWAYESGGEETSFQDLGFSQLGRRWTEDSCTDSSIDESFLKSKDPMEWSDDSSIVSLYQHDGCITDDFESNRATDDNTTIRSILSEPSIGTNLEELKNEAEWNYTLDCNVPILEVKFPPVKTWITETPLEVLLGEASGPQEKYPPAKEDANHILNIQQHDPFPFQDLDRSQPLLDVEELTLPTEASTSHIALHGHESGDQQLFSSLI